MQMHNPGTPTLEQRLAYPDRLWIVENDEPPATNGSRYAISNANGTLPAFWSYRGSAGKKSPSGNETQALPLQKRLPTYVNVYENIGCVNWQAQILNPTSGQCYGDLAQTSIQAIYIPSATTGDIFNIYLDDSCMEYWYQLQEYIGCFSAPPAVTFFSIYPCNVCN